MYSKRVHQFKDVKNDEKRVMVTIESKTYETYPDFSDFTL